jgi:hypothetical protein
MPQAMIDVVVSPCRFLDSRVNSNFSKLASESMSNWSMSLYVTILPLLNPMVRLPSAVFSKPSLSTKMSLIASLGVMVPLNSIPSIVLT